VAISTSSRVESRKIATEKEKNKMMRRVLALIAGIALAGFNLLALPRNGSPQPEVLRGWLSDEQCARGRAQSGAFTGTNPDCAKKCVSEGKKIVLVDPEGKRVLVLANQEIGKSHVGDYVEITGEVDAKAMTIHADSLKFLEKGAAMCGAKPKKTAPK
jgi:hypothetical protein